MSLHDFVVLQKLGSGSFASVYKVRRLIDQQIYALKKIDLKALGLKEKNNALNQIRLLACLCSPYIIGYCESFFQEKHDILCIAMQYANEGDLLKKIEKQKKLRSLMPEVEVWKIFIHLLYGLNELHSKNILHRDMKSENIFIANGVYKIGDMNVSKIIKNGLASTQTGTPYYASPEVWNDQPYNQKSDIYSLGCILYQVAALRPPYEASNMEKLFNMVTRSPPPRIPNNYSKQLQSIIDLCLQKNPKNRPSTKDLLLNKTVKIYENMLIQFKPQIGVSLKEPMLRTIYMPNSKKQLKHHLPQSNYKNSCEEKESHSKQQNSSQNKKRALQIQTIQSKIKQIFTPEQKMTLQQNKGNVVLSSIANIKNQIQSIVQSRDVLLIKKHDSQSSSKPRSRIQSCNIFKDQSSHKINKSNSKENLMARADFIIESQRKPLKSKEEYKQVNKDRNVERLPPKSTGKKEQKLFYEQKLLNEPQSLVAMKNKLTKEIYIDVEDDQIMIKPRKLIFDQQTQIREKEKNTETLRKSQKMIKPTNRSQQSEQSLYLLLKKQDLSISVRTQTPSQEKQTQTPKKYDISPTQILKQNILPKEEIYRQLQNRDQKPLVKNNASGISQNNHSHYDFDKKIPKKSEGIIVQDILENQQIEKESANQKIQQIENTEKQALDLIIWSKGRKSIQAQPQKECQPVNIFIDLNNNERHNAILIQHLKYQTSEQKMSLILGIQKLKNVVQQVTFKNKNFTICLMNKEIIRLKMMHREEEFKIKLHQQSHKHIIQPLTKTETNITQMKTTYSNQSQATANKKTCQKRNRSKSIRKTQKCNSKTALQVPDNQNKQSKQSQHIILVQKIIQNTNNQSSRKKSTQKSKEKLQMKQKSNKKIFGNENVQAQSQIQKLNQKLKQMALVPKCIISSDSKNALKQKKIGEQNYIFSSQTVKCSALKVIQSKNLLGIPQRNEKKIAVNHIFSQGQSAFQQKKKKIFQNINPVHELSDKLDRINLQNKMKRYINV